MQQKVSSETGCAHLPIARRDPFTHRSFMSIPAIVSVMFHHRVRGSFSVQVQCNEAIRLLNARSASTSTNTTFFYTDLLLM